MTTNTQRVERMLLDHGPLIETIQHYAATAGVQFGTVGTARLMLGNELDAETERRLGAQITDLWGKFIAEHGSPLVLDVDGLIGLADMVYGT